MPPPSMEIKCDICSSTQRKFHLRRCRECRVAVHAECYGLGEQSERPFTCWACEAVGKQIKGRTPQGKIVTVKVQERPTDCVFCCKSTGAHAMNAIYDTHGKKGRHLVLANGKQQKLAWCHSLCAGALGQNRATRSSVYGCTKTGIFQDMEDEDESSASGSDHDSTEASDADADDDTPLDVHHYVITATSEKVVWGSLNEHMELKCMECKTDTNKPYRIPIQCTAGDRQECRIFARAHRGEEPCRVAMHVGCAMWSSTKNRRVFFYPGCEEEEPIVEVYCPKHARQITRSFDNVAKSPEESNRASDPATDREPPRKTIPTKMHRGGQKMRNTYRIAPNQAPGTARAAKKISMINLPPKKGQKAVLLRAATASDAIALGKSFDKSKMKPLGRKLSDSGIPRKNPPGSNGPRRSSESVLNIPRENPTNNVPRRSSESILNIPRKNPPSASLQKPMGFIPRKSPEYGKKINASASLLAASFPKPPSLSVPRKSSITTAKTNLIRNTSGNRSLGSYIDGAKQTQEMERSPPVVARRINKASAAIASSDQPPAYARHSDSISPPTKKAAKRGRTDDTDHPSTKRIRRRRISESKSDGSVPVYQEESDWVEAMSFDVREVLAHAKKQGHEDMKSIISLRKVYWKAKSGIYGSDFMTIWDQVTQATGNDHIRPAPPKYESEELRPVGKTNRWASLWDHGAKHFEITEMDSTKTCVAPARKLSSTKK